MILPLFFFFLYEYMLFFREVWGFSPTSIHLINRSVKMFLKMKIARLPLHLFSIGSPLFFFLFILDFQFYFKENLFTFSGLFYPQFSVFFFLLGKKRKIKYNMCVYMNFREAKKKKKILNVNALDWIFQVDFYFCVWIFFLFPNLFV